MWHMRSPRIARWFSGARVFSSSASCFSSPDWYSLWWAEQNSSRGQQPATQHCLLVVAEIALRQAKRPRQTKWTIDPWTSSRWSCHQAAWRAAAATTRRKIWPNDSTKRWSRYVWRARQMAPRWALTTSKSFDWPLLLLSSHFLSFLLSFLRIPGNVNRESFFLQSYNHMCVCACSSLILRWTLLFYIASSQIDILRISCPYSSSTAHSSFLLFIYLFIYYVELFKMKSNQMSSREIELRASELSFCAHANKSSSQMNYWGMNR